MNKFSKLENFLFTPLIRVHFAQPPLLSGFQFYDGQEISNSTDSSLSFSKNGQHLISTYGGPSTLPWALGIVIHLKWVPGWLRKLWDLGHLGVVRWIYVLMYPSVSSLWFASLLPTSFSDWLPALEGEGLKKKNFSVSWAGGTFLGSGDCWWHQHE